MTSTRWTVGITHLIEPPFEPENTAFDGQAEFAHFSARDEAEFDTAALKRLDAMLVWTPVIGERTVRHLDRCRILVRYGVGFDRIDLDALAARNIAFANNPEYGPEDIADTAMAMILGLQRRIVEHDVRARVYRKVWQENILTPVLNSKRATVGIVGLGRIGSCLSRRLRPFGYRTIAYDPYLQDSRFLELGVERAESLEALVEQVDILSMHCPLTDETRAMIDAEVLGRARPGLIFVNTARGALIDSLDTLETALRSGHLAAAGLDVLPQEPPADHSLIDAWRNAAEWLQGRLLINPHNAFYSDESMARCRFNAAETARLFLQEQIHRNAV